MAKWAVYSTASCSCRGSKKMLVNAVVKMQWVVPHSLAQPDLHIFSCYCALEFVAQLTRCLTSYGDCFYTRAWVQGYKTSTTKQALAPSEESGGFGET